MFLSINYRYLRLSEFIQFFQNFLQLLSANDPEALKVKSQYDDLHALVATLASFYKQELGSEITTELQELDAKRDSAIQGIELQVKSYIHHYDDLIRAAAILMANFFDNYGWDIDRLNYQAETSTISSMVEKWEGEQKYIDAIAALKLSDWTTELKNTNTSFNQRYLARVEENAEHPEASSNEMRAGIIVSYRKLMDHLQAYATLSSGGEYDKITKLINQLVDEYNKMLAPRIKSKKETSPETENQETPAEEAAE
ncbi:hypothetical protein DF185_17750 [Marinifilum breve]|uniref:Uncharacterized protein n=1 Tax=Marinifilum breve TaxID=2184082 RepID=A0A2V3ZTS6_9BACT|nr:DUF6261 family protein [Marinifilum breve]PXX97812.1 hypothetical protein DF185_17750 [Marinifilum breve]